MSRDELYDAVKQIDDTQLIVLVKDLHSYHYDRSWDCSVKKGSTIDKFYAPFRSEGIWFDTIELEVMRESHKRFSSVVKMMLINSPITYIKTL